MPTHFTCPSVSRTCSTRGCESSDCRRLGCEMFVTDKICKTTGPTIRSEEHTSELQSLMRISYAVFCLQKKTKHTRPSHKQTPNTKKPTLITHISTTRTI